MKKIIICPEEQEIINYFGEYILDIVIDNIVYFRKFKYNTPSQYDKLKNALKKKNLNNNDLDKLNIFIRKYADKYVNDKLFHEMNDNYKMI